jgi:hypothetical protein
MFRKSLLWAMFLGVLPSLAIAQGDDRTNVVLETIEYMRGELGANMVLDGIMRADYLRQGKSTDILDTIARELDIKTLSSVAERRCNNGFSYYRGAEKFIRFEEPTILGDSASVTVDVSFTPDNNPRLLYSSFRQTKVRLKRIDQRWVAIGQTKQEHQHLTAAFCDQ